MQYVRRPSLAGLIEYIDREHLILVSAEMRYAESLINALKKQGLKIENIHQLALTVNSEIEHYFSDFRQEVESNYFSENLTVINQVRSANYSSSNFIFVGVNKNGLPKIAFVDV